MTANSVLSRARPGQSVRIDRDIRFGSARYAFCVRNGPDTWPELGRRLAELDADFFLLVTDGGIPDSLVARTESVLTGIAPVRRLTVPPGESSKDLATIDRLAGQAIAAGATRKSVVVALGGGVAGNVAGLVAALLFRGIRLVHMPTTLLGMSDSALSLKQAVNSRHGKNHLGTFHAPVLVWNDLSFLATLPPEEISSALCEMIKNVLGIVPHRYDEVARSLRPHAQYSAPQLARFIELCVDAKSRVMARDQYEKGEALVLEYGHTVGHAAESLSQGRIRHGFAIGLGMLAAARVSRSLGLLSDGDVAAHEELLRLNGAPVRLAGLDTDAVIERCRLDNKRGYLRTRAGHLDLVLLAGLGRPHRRAGSLITQVNEATVRDAVADLSEYEQIMAGV